MSDIFNRVNPKGVYMKAFVCFISFSAFRKHLHEDRFVRKVFDAVQSWFDPVERVHIGVMLLKPVKAVLREIPCNPKPL